jgi:hypothetical protein
VEQTLRSGLSFVIDFHHHADVQRRQLRRELEPGGQWVSRDHISSMIAPPPYATGASDSTEVK